MAKWLQNLHSDQMHDACSVATIIFQRKIQTNVESFTLTAKLNAVSFSCELRPRKLLTGFKLQGSERPDVT